MICCMSITLALLSSAARVACLSTLIGSRWQVKLDIGLEPGSYFHRTGWGSSGGRLPITALVDFEETASTHAEELVGPLRGTRVLTARSGGKFVSMEGEQTVTFESGGWCVQRAVFSTPSSPGLLRFWLDCKSGATKGDLVIEPGERIFFSTTTWDDADELAHMIKRCAVVESGLAKVDASARSGDCDDSPISRLPGVSQLLAFRKAVQADEERSALKSEALFFAQFSNLAKSPAAVACSRGGLSVKRQSSQDWLGSRNDVYHILGSFELEPVA